ncbi:hypothetical protein CYMTET_33623 [Cymbomonas tetramitiformis]|uniref:Proteasome assembly chaperone 2 n=1 Tax=Cymbomonas tetramitiformis TaxID=36881 RepID=A0AAE0KR01_9CHLO|nr:hypothetical protein CYMTET_33623 [Cymbomonas tetramitiformis]
MNFFSAGKHIDFEGCTLIAPTVSAGNLGQLTVDLLVSTLSLVRVGYLEDDNVLPCIGNDPYNAEPTGSLALGLELYSDSKRTIVCLQQRAPAMPGRSRAFAKNLSKWISASKFKDVIVLAGVEAAWRTEQRIGLGFQLRYVCSSSDGKLERCEALGWKLLEDEAFVHGFGQLGKDESRSPPWPLFQAIAAGENSPQALALMGFVNEGDNIPDALQLATVLANYLNLEGFGDGSSYQWRIPPSWAHLYGPPQDDCLY